MDSIFVSPGRYIQGKNTLKNLGVYAEKLGKKPFILVSKGGMKRIGDMLLNACKEKDLDATAEIFGGESTRNEVLRLAALMEEIGSDLVIGVGGGKVTDTAKMAAVERNLPVIICPTIAATDGPTAGRAVLYSEEHVSLQTLQLPASPNVVLVDTEVIANAPARLLVSGMGDALATYFETSTCVVTNHPAPNGGLSTLAGRALAKACFDTLMSDGVQASIDAKDHICSEAVEHIIETNTLLSGLGFESGGLGAAHAINKGLTYVRECDALYHGEKVAYGTLAQILIEEQPEELIEQVFTFCAKVGLPVCFSDLGIEGIEEEKLWKAAEVAADPKGHAKNEPVKVTKEMVFDAFSRVDARGRETKKKLGL